MDLCVLIFCEPHKEKEGLGFEYGALLGRVFKCLSKLVGLAFYLPPMLLARCPCGSQRIVVRGRKLVPRANAKKVFLTNRSPRWLALSGCLRILQINMDSY